jgi:hypothetical protein
LHGTILVRGPASKQASRQFPLPPLNKVVPSQRHAITPIKLAGCLDHERTGGAVQRVPEAGAAVAAQKHRGPASVASG